MLLHSITLAVFASCAVQSFFLNLTPKSSAVQTPAHGFQHVSGWRQQGLNKTRRKATALSTGGVMSSQLKAGGQLRLPSSLAPCYWDPCRFNRMHNWLAGRREMGADWLIYIGSYWFQLQREGGGNNTLGQGTKLRRTYIKKKPRREEGLHECAGWWEQERVELQSCRILNPAYGGIRVLVLQWVCGSNMQLAPLPCTAAVEE